MSRPTRQPRRFISGPQSALTDFLASHNISATVIARSANERRRAAAESQPQPGGVAGTQNENSNEVEHEEEVQEITSNDDDFVTEEVIPSRGSRRETNAQKQARKLKEQRAIAKIKASKAFKKRKRLSGRNDDDSDDSLAESIMREHNTPMPGQMENCAICGKRFTVTPYSRASPEGGLVCTRCGKDLDNDKPQTKKKPRKSTSGVGRRRTIQSRILDGTYNLGAKPLVTLCVEILAKNVDLADDLGDLPDHQIDKIARMFSKRRLLNPRTLPLFVRPNTERLNIYDGAYLGEDDFTRSMAVTGGLKHLKIRNAIQFKDTVMEYLLTRSFKLETLYIHGANLLSSKIWERFLAEKGDALQSLQIYCTDRHVGDETIAALQQHCPNLIRLKLYHNQKVTNDGVKAIAKIQGLQHLGLKLHEKTTSKAYVEVIKSLGANLRTLSLKILAPANDDILDAIHQHCRMLTKLQITDSEEMTDEGFTHLFTNWENPALRYINFEKCRYLDSTSPSENDDKIGLCSDGFRALMKHSGKKLEVLNIHACRHISAEAFEEVFASGVEYPLLQKLEISFCEAVTPFIMVGIFKSCPNLRKLNVFGCMRVKDRGLKVPPGVNMVGGADAFGSMYAGMELD